VTEVVVSVPCQTPAICAFDADDGPDALLPQEIAKAITGKNDTRFISASLDK